MAKLTGFGLKEVADVEFYPRLTNVTVTAGTAQAGPGITVTPTSTAAKYTFDSLKVSNIEVASEDVSARGGKGNPELISWSYGKEITFTMEDALLSTDTLDLMFGAKEDGGSTLTIDANSFPEYYTIIGKTVVRSYEDGHDEPFIFVIPKAKVQVNGTLTMEAEGDPSTLELTIKAMSATLGDDEDVVIKFFQPGIAEG